MQVIKDNDQLGGCTPYLLALGIVKDSTSLEELDFIGRLQDRFPERQPRLITDQRGEQQRLSLSDVDMLVSSSVGGLSYRRCQFYQNVVYAPT